MKLKKPACLIPWISLWPKPDGFVYPCCVSDINISKLGNLKEQSLKEIFHGEKMNSLRKKFMEGNLDEEICRICIDTERYQGESHRNYINRMFGEFSEELLKDTNQKGETTQFRIMFADFIFSNLCNFKCVHCNPSVSHSIAGVPELADFYNYKNKKAQSLSQVNQSVTKELLEAFDKQGIFHFNGGEPFLTKEYYDILEFFIENNYTDVRLLIHTNLSILSFKNKSIADLLQHFSNVSIFPSHDGFGERGSFVRTGYKDELFLKNYRFFQKLGFKIYPAVSVHALNIWHLTDLLDWYKKNELVALGAVNLNCVLSPAFIRYNLLDKETKQKIIIKITRWLDKNKTEKNLLTNKVNQIAKSLSFSNENNKKDCSKLAKYLEIKKEKLKQDCYNVFPEYENFFRLIGVKK